MDFRFYVIFHKFLTTEAYEKLNPFYIQKYCRFIAVNGQIQKEPLPESLVHYTIEERQLPWYNPFMQFNRFCESSVFFHTWKNEKLLLGPLKFVGFLQYDMVLEDSLFQTIEHVLETVEESEKTLFVHYAENSARHLLQCIGREGWKVIIDLYNHIYQTNHTIDNVLQYDIPLYHCYLIPRDIFMKMMEFAERAFPLIFEMLGFDTQHLPYHFERCHGIFLLLYTLDKKIVRWVKLPGIEHREGIKDPWQVVRSNGV